MGVHGGIPLNRRLVIGTRRSRLALIQARLVAEALCEASVGLDVEFREVTTAGDRMPEKPLGESSETGLFTRALERKLLEGEIDLAVHSLKDLPVELAEGLVLAATPERADPRDALLAREARSLAELREHAVVGTSSPRRSAQLRALRADLVTRELRGNVDTRIEKLRRGDYDAIVVAKAALDRLGLAGLITEVLDPERFLPACAQGALAIETREGDLDVTRLASRVNHAGTYVATLAERELLRRLGGGCHLTLGVLAECVGEEALRLRATVTSPDGARTVRAEAHGDIRNPARVVDQCLDQLRRRGASTLVP
jgi:hydroxymethylbilane synthase